MGEKIFIYSDCKSSYTLSIILSKYGYSSNTIEQKTKLIKTINNLKSAILILDTNLITEEKINFLKKLSKNNSINIIILSDEISVEKLQVLLNLNIDNFFSKPFNEIKLVNAVESLVDQVKLIKKNEYLVSKLKNKVNKFKLLNQTAKMINSSLNIKDILQKLIINMGKIVDAKAWSLLIYNKQKNNLKFEYVVGKQADKLKGKEISLNKGIVGWAASNKESVLVKDTQEDERFYRYFDNLTDFKTKSVICIPIIHRKELLGVIEVVNKKNKQSFNNEDLNILEILVENAAISIKNSYLLEKVYNISLKDHLTNLYNFRKLNKTIDNLIKENTSFSLIFMDIDNFKDINDKYGHQYGSQTLIEFGNIIEELINKPDLGFRYGGDEFIVILKDEDIKTSKDFSTSILQMLKKHNFLKKNNINIKLGVSIGITHFPTLAKTKKEILSQADQAMYEVKNQSKNNYKIFK